VSKPFDLEKIYGVVDEALAASITPV